MGSLSQIFLRRLITFEVRGVVQVFWKKMEGSLVILNFFFGGRGSTVICRNNNIYTAYRNHQSSTLVAPSALSGHTNLAACSVHVVATGLRAVPRRCWPHFCVGLSPPPAASTRKTWLIPRHYITFRAGRRRIFGVSRVRRKRCQNFDKLYV